MKQPNILFIHVDQMRYDAIGAYGCKHVSTPNLDRLVQGGTSFSQSYSANPTCCPARTSWYTGRMASEHGVTINGLPIAIPDCPDLGQWLPKHGYNCYYAGKWHIPRPLKDSFTVLYDGSGVGERIDPLASRTTEAFLYSYDEDKPFFMNTGFLNPHDICFWKFGRTPGKWEAGKFVRDELPELPVSYNSDIPDLNEEFHSEDNLRFYMYSYYRMVEMVDAEIGRILHALETSKFKDNTILIFSADHGEGLLDNNRTSKGFLYNSATKVPMIWYAPGLILSGRMASDPVCNVDIPATILDYAAAPLMPGMTFSKSLRPALETGVAVDRNYVVSETARSMEHTAIISKGMKVIFADNPESRLAAFGSLRNVVAFDLEKDPYEMTDVADQPQYAEQIEQYRNYYNEYLATIDRLPLPEGGWSNELKRMGSQGAEEQ